MPHGCIGRRPIQTQLIWRNGLLLFKMVKLNCQDSALTPLTGWKNWLVQYYKTERDHLKKHEKLTALLLLYVSN